jgi:multiple sugar transport system substrate-binding protein
LSKFKSTYLYSFVAPVILTVSLFGLAAALPGCKEKPFQKVELEFWGVFDDSDIYQPLILDFNEKFSHIKIKYYKKNFQTYEKELLEAMASGRGPDILMLHNSWVPRYLNKVQIAPVELITLKEVRDNFVDVVYDDFVTNNSLFALPLSVDTLALYYNKDIFNTVGIAQPPQTWEEFREAVKKLTIVDEKGDIVRAGAAIGTAYNINRSTDILSLLMLQSGARMINKQKTKAVFDESVLLEGKAFYPGQRALEFYTDFANPLKSVYTWNSRLHYSIDAFYEGQTAMMLNYSYHIPTIRAKSPYLNFGISAMPQIKTAQKDVNYANYWGLAVSRNSSNSKEAWQFIVWLTNSENARRYLEITKKPTARRDLISWQRNDLDLGVFAKQALTARSWYQVDNSAIETIFADMIESVVLGQATVRDALEKAASQMDLLMRK